MSERSNDDLARALEGLSNGRHPSDTAHGAEPGESDHVPLDGSANAGTTRPAANRPAATGRPAAPGQPSRPGAAARAPSPTRPATPAPARPAPPGSPALPAAAQPGRPPVPRSAPARPAAPGAPPSRTAARAAPPSRPASPGAAPAGPARPQRAAAPAGAAVPPAEAPEVVNVEVAPVDEDDRVIVPAMPLSYRSPQPAPARPAQPLFKSLRFRQTVIPVLFTCGLMLILLGSLRYVLPMFEATEESPIVRLPAWVPIPLFVFALFMWGLSVMNMLSVRHALASGQRP